MDETKTSTNGILTIETKRKRRQLSNLQCERNGNVDKCHTYNVDEAETLTNVIVTRRTKRKRRQMPYLQCGRSGNVDKCHSNKVDERKRRQMSYLPT